MLDLPVRDLVDATHRLMVLWYCQDEELVKQTEKIERYYRDRESEYETGELVLPGWASLGNVADQYGSDGSSPFG